jgi:glycosyltransferase involved in cell wall biosynthesis
MVKDRLGHLEEDPLVSVFCPTYNAEKFIEKTLRSILEQDYKNLEVIVSDDCSTDGTVEIIKTFSKEYPGKIVLNVNTKNLGITSNCNITLKLCRGKYIALFAGDDLMYPGKISTQVTAMESNSDCSVSYHSVDILDGDNHNKKLFTTEQGKTSYSSFFDVVKRGGIIGCCSLMIRADALPHYGYLKSFPHVSDWLMHIDLSLRGRIIKVEGVYAGYIRHKNGLSRKTFETLSEIKNTINFINARYNYAPEILSATRKAYRRYLMGEMARLFILGDLERLKELYHNYLKGMFLQKFITIIFIMLVLLKFHNTQVTKRVFTAMSMYLK